MRYKPQDPIKESKYRAMISTAFHLYGNSEAFTNFCKKHGYHDVTIERIDFTIKEIEEKLEALDAEDA